MVFVQAKNNFIKNIYGKQDLPNRVDYRKNCDI